ncbi:3-ketodihydrosphingosine reductase TSC10 [Hypsizygus marmoreus]|uniref:3-dehydrosphinganine reductase n=1 Tax=Hypsizygus marmoreus TaxID=39966 RepID=A0A369JAR6_HYPMA|nr:3-ketodihydrosphingosine reductase TSC10 [Hypsizygus marmoreus]
MFFSSKWNPDGLHTYVTGGSTGLGLSLAILLTKRGAHVSIVARNKERLDNALAQLEDARVRPEQILKAYSFSLNNAKDSADALKAACMPHEGRAPDAVFACAGGSKPMFFVEMEEQDLIDGMTNGYWVQAWTAFAAAKQMAREQRRGKIVFVSSTLGYMSFLGWSSYSPAKHALRGLADTLQSELMLYGIDVHIFFPPTMFTPGFDEENKTKPKIVREIESADDGLTADQAALAMFKGVESGQAHITGDLITALFRSSTRGASPRNNWILDGLFDFVAYIATPIWRSSVDKKVVAHREEHREYLRSAGFFA